MDQYCVVLCGLQAGTSEDAAAWQPVAAALKLDHDEFERRVVAALPRIVRQNMDRNTADRVAQLLRAMHVDARVLPDDPQLVYIDGPAASCGPLPLSSLGDFIQPGESYRLYGSTTWQPWPAPVDGEPAAATVDPGEIHDATPTVSTGDAPERATPPPLSSPPAVPPSIPQFTSDLDGSVPEPDATAAARAGDRIDPPRETPTPGVPETPAPISSEVTPAAVPRRSRTARLVLLVVVAALAIWAYRYWTANSPVVAPPVAAEAIPPSGADPGESAPPARVIPGDDAMPSAAAPSAAETAPAPAAATTAAAPAAAGSAPGTAASAPTPPPAASTPMPAAGIGASAQSATDTLPAGAGTVTPARSER